MDFAYPAAVEAFRAELRAWLEANVPPGLRGLSFADGISRARIEELRAWNRRLADAGWAAISWPVEYGGRGAGALEQVVFAEETARAEAPPPLNPIGLANIAPAIMAHGSAEQKRELLPRMLRGDHIWCQGFSEPDAGSDLASLRTSARLSGDHFLVNGQKVWTTLGEHADWCELLVRSDPAAPRHAGISALLVPMKSPGIEVRPLRTNTGGSDFSQIFFTDVRVPASALLGPLHGGWAVAMTTLTHERAGVASLHLGVRRKIARLLAAAREHRVDGRPASDDPRLRRELARCYLLGEQLRFLADRAVSAAAKGRDPGAESSLAKLTWSDVEHEIARTAGAVLGHEANAGRWGHERLQAPSTSIAGGTTQVNKNIIAQRVLGLPKAG